MTRQQHHRLALTRIASQDLSGTRHFLSQGFCQLPEPFGFCSSHLTPARLHSSVKSYLWSADQTSLIKVEQDIPKLPGSAIVLDWHQVLDTDRLTTRRTEERDSRYRAKRSSGATGLDHDSKDGSKGEACSTSFSDQREVLFVRRQLRKSFRSFLKQVDPSHRS